jgi:hypothetical protein
LEKYKKRRREGQGIKSDPGKGYVMMSYAAEEAGAVPSETSSGHFLVGLSRIIGYIDS